MSKKLVLPFLSAFFVLFILLSIFRANDADAHFGTAIQPAVNLANSGTGFSYQGQLVESGSPANGDYDFLFELYDSATPDSGVLVGSFDIQDQPVSNGLFNVVLDFGDVFDGSGLWLEIHVRPGDSKEDYETLLPRQPILAAPYASYALKAGSLPWSGITEIPAGFSDSTDDDSLSELTCAENQVLKWDGSTWICATDQTSAQYGWSLTGDAGTTPGINFLGTTDNQPLQIHVNSQRVLRLEPDATSPNIIGGYMGNSVDTSTVGATISGGGRDLAINQANGDFSTVNGGAGNTTEGYAAYLGGGEGNLVSGNYAGVVGGTSNQASGNYSTIAGGQLNSVLGLYGIVGGGINNQVTGAFGTVAGGANNAALANYASVSGGSNNRVYGEYGTIAGGGPADTGNPSTSNNLVWDEYGTIAGGGGNTAGSEDGDPTTARGATVAGGTYNQASEEYATIGGGSDNQADHYATVISGGYNNTASGNYATVAGGTSNNAGNTSASVSGGQSNSASGVYSTIGGGSGNQVVAPYGMIPGGVQNYVSGNYGFAAGNQARAEHAGSFVWSDSQGGSFASTASDQFLINATGGVGIGTNAPTEQLSVVGNTELNGNLNVARNGTLYASGQLSAQGTYSDYLQAPSAIDFSGTHIFVTSYATNTLTIIDVSDADHPRPIHYTTSNLAGPRDIQVKGELAYIASQNNNRLVIIDISNPSAPDSISSSDKNLDHPQALHVVGNYAYVASHGGSGGPDGLSIFEIADPHQVLNVGYITDMLDGTSDVFVQGSHAYVTSQNNDRLVIFDVSNPTNIQARGYSSNSLDSPLGVHVRDSYAYVINENSAGNSNDLVIFDISNPNNIVPVGQISNSLSLVRPQDVYVSGDLVYVVYNGDSVNGANSGLAIFDVSDPENIVEHSTIDMNGSGEQPTAIAGNGPFIYIAWENDDQHAVTIYKDNHLYASIIKAGVLQVSNLEATDDARINADLSVRGGLNVGPGGALIEGQLAVSGSADNYIYGNLNIGPAGVVLTDTTSTEIRYPTHKLDVHGEGRFRVNRHNNLVIRSQNSGSDEDAYIDFVRNSQTTVLTPTARIEFDAANPITHTTGIKFYTQSSDEAELSSRLEITPNGDVIPGMDGSYLLGSSTRRWAAVFSVNGVIQTSDVRFKENINPIPYGLAEVKALNPVRFNWKDEPPEQIHYGLVAQDVMAVLPEIVESMDDPDALLGLNYSELVPVLISAVQEQQTEIETQADQIASLEARLAVLESSSNTYRFSTNMQGLLTWFGYLSLLVLMVGILQKLFQRRLRS